MLEKVSGLGFRVLDKKRKNEDFLWKTVLKVPLALSLGSHGLTERGPTLPDVHVVKEDKQ